jgi:hypothetical protein
LNEEVIRKDEFKINKKSVIVCAGLGLGAALAVFNSYRATKVPDDELIQMSLK